MPNRSRTSKDLNARAFSIVQQITQQATGEVESEYQVHVAKNPAAVALGRLGGLKGGKARAAVLTKEKREEIAKKAAAARWKTNG